MVFLKEALSFQTPIRISMKIDPYCSLFRKRKIGYFRIKEVGLYG